MTRRNTPAPPPDVSIWMKRFIGQYLAETADLSPTEDSVYNHLQMYYWRKGPFGPDPAKLAQVCKLTTPDAWNIIKGVLDELFELREDGLYHHSHLDETLADAQSRQLAAHNRGVAGGNAKRDAQAVLKQDSSVAQAVLKQWPSATATASALVPPTAPTAEAEKQDPPGGSGSCFSGTKTRVSSPSPPQKCPNGSPNRPSLSRAEERARWLLHELTNEPNDDMCPVLAKAIAFVADNKAGFNTGGDIDKAAVCLERMVRLAAQAEGSNISAQWFDTAQFMRYVTREPSKGIPHVSDNGRPQ